MTMDDFIGGVLILFFRVLKASPFIANEMTVDRAYELGKRYIEQIARLDFDLDPVLVWRLWVGCDKEVK